MELPSTVRTGWLLRGPCLAMCLIAATPVGSSTHADNPPLPRVGADACRAADVGVQVLGSGGPIAEGGRAGTSYVVWIDGQGQLLIDAGPGSFIRFGEAGLKVGDLKAIALSHFHADHSAGLAGILNSGSFEQTSEPLIFIGPAGASVFPGATAFLAAQFGRSNSAWPYLGGYLDGGDSRRPMIVREIAADDTENGILTSIEITPDLTVAAVPVHHGEVPSLGYVVKAKGRRIVFASDQSAFSAGFELALKDLSPDLLVAHHVIPEGEGQPIGLHRPPGEIGRMAAVISPQRLLLSHHMTRSLSRLEEGLAAISVHYTGPTDIADDGTCVLL